MMVLGYYLMIAGGAASVLALVLSAWWHRATDRLPDPGEGDEPWDAAEWASLQRRRALLDWVRLLGVLCLYGGITGATFGFLLVGMAGVGWIDAGGACDVQI